MCHTLECFRRWTVRLGVRDLQRHKDELDSDAFISTRREDLGSSKLTGWFVDNEPQQLTLTPRDSHAWVTAHSDERNHMPWLLLQALAPSTSPLVRGYSLSKAVILENDAQERYAQMSHALFLGCVCVGGGEGRRSLDWRGRDN